MSELERERHKNTGLERARDSWYQEYYKANQRAEQLEDTIERLKEQLHLCNVDQFNVEARCVDLAEEAADRIGALNQAEAELLVLWESHSKHHPSCEDCGDSVETERGTA